MNTNAKKVEENGMRKQPWSYRPSKEVEALVEQFIAETGVNRNSLINEALRGKVAKAALRLSEQELVAKLRQIEQLRDLARKEDGVNPGKALSADTESKVLKTAQDLIAKMLRTGRSRSGSSVLPL